MKTLLHLTSENYHSLEANRDYFSVSQFKNFVSCSAKTMASLNGVYVEPSSAAMLVGSYVHSAFDGPDEFEKLIEENSKSIFKSRGGKYAEYEKADEMIDCIKQDDFAMYAMEGEKEQIYTAECFGAPWKIKVDSINFERKTFTDLKTTRSLSERYWSSKYQMYVGFVEAWDYVMQMALYREVLLNSTANLYTPYIVAVTKESPPDKAVLHFESTRFQFELDYVESMMDQFIKMKQGSMTPVRCEKCAFCRSTKKLNNTLEIGALID